MAVTITDNQTPINSADANTGWTSSIAYSGFQREGTACLGDQIGNGYSEMILAITSADYTGRTIFGWSRSGNPHLESADGFGIILGSGTAVDVYAYTVGGSDNWGCFVSGWGGFRLDLANLPTGLRIISGAAPTLTAITDIGYSTGYNSKANGNADNVFWDQLKWIANGSPALSLAGGTVGVPSTFLDIAVADIATTATAAYGIVRELVGAKAYEMFYGCEWGHATTDTYFADADFQLFVNGAGSGDAGMTVGNMDMSLLAGTGTNLFTWDNFVCVGVGTPAAWDFSPLFETLEITNGSFTNAGAIDFPVTGGTSRKCEFVNFINCGQVNPSTMAFNDISFTGTTDANGALLLSSTTNLSTMAFTSDGTGHAIYITAIGTYTLTDFTYVGYGADATTDAVIYNNSGGLVTLAVSGGNTPTVLNGASATTDLTNAVTVRVEGVSEGSAIKVVANETVGTLTVGDIIFELLADSTGAAQDTGFNYEGAFEPTGLDVIVRARNQGFPSAAIADDNGVFVDETTASNSATVDDLTLLPATPVVNEDRFLFGHAEQFNQLKVDVSTAGTGGFTITWQYWNGAWTALTGVTDGTNSFSLDGEKKITYTMPGDWVTSTVNGQGPFYFIRAAYTAGTVTITPSARKVKLDVSRYLPFNGERIVTSTGLTVVAAWTRDSIATF